MYKKTQYKNTNILVCRFSNFQTNIESKREHIIR